MLYEVITLVATLRSRPLLIATVMACIGATYMGLLQPTKPGRFQAAVINRSVVAGVLLAVAYIGMTREERKAREEAARAALAHQTRITSYNVCYTKLLRQCSS